MEQNNNRQLRWGIVGCAGIAINAVMPAIQQSASGSLAAIASRNLDKGREVASRFNVPKAYGSYEELLADEDIDAVYIPLPNHLHKEWAIRAAEAGKHVLCEKPLALTAAEAEEMAAAAAKAGVVLTEAFMYRHHPRWSRIRAILDGGEIGELRAIRGAFTFNNAEDLANIRLKPEWGGGSLYDVGCYPLSAARFLLGQEPEAVTVLAQFSDRHGGVDMMASGLAEFPGGVGLTFDCGMWTEHRQLLEIVGSEGTIELPLAFTAGGDDAAFTVTVRGEKRTEVPESANPYVAELDDFAAAAFGERPPRFAPADAVKGMAVLEACLASARERRRVEL